MDILTFRSETRASLLANKGFVVLAISLVEGKFESFEQYPRFHLDYFEEAIDFLKKQPKVSQSNDLQLIGILMRLKRKEIK